MVKWVRYSFFLLEINPLTALSLLLGQPKQAALQASHPSAHLLPRNTSGPSPVQDPLSTSLLFAEHIL